MELNEFLERLERVKQHGSYHMARCPAHEDKDASLSIKQTGDKILLKCHAGCSGESIISKLGLEWSDLFVDYATRPATEYVYTDATGKPLFKKVRKVINGKKTFMQLGYKDGRYVSGKAFLNGRSKTLYRLPELIEGIKSGKTVYINEGEKAVEALVSTWGAVATCQPEGAGNGKWLPEHTKVFKKANVVIVADRDKPGEDYAREVAQALMRDAASVRIVQSATTRDKDDAYDHIKGGFKDSDWIVREDLLKAEPIEDQFERLGLTRLSDVDPVEVEWLWYPYIPLRRCTLLDGDGDVGKTYMFCALAAAITRGKLPDGTPLPNGPANVLLLMSEDEADDTLVPRIIKFGGDRERIVHKKVLFPFDEAGIQHLRQCYDAVSPLLVGIDPVLAYCSAAVNINQANEVRPIFDKLRQAASDFGNATVNIRHTGKSNEGRAAHHAGLGSVDIRNAHRSQLSVSWHKNEKGLRVVSHEKHNLSEKGASFGYEFKQGEFHWRWDIPDEDDLAGKPRLQQAIDFLKEVCTGQYVPVVKVVELAKQRGISEATLKNARKELTDQGVLQIKKVGADGGWVLIIEEDPFA